jgi:hypothetical protein
MPGQALGGCTIVLIYYLDVQLCYTMQRQSTPSNYDLFQL